MGGTNAPKYIPAVVEYALSVVPSRNRSVPRYNGSYRTIQSSRVEIDDGGGIQVPGNISTGNLATTGFVLPNVDGAAGQVLTTDGTGVVSWTSAGGSGDVVGPASATDEALARYDGATGKLIKNSTLYANGAGVLYPAAAGTQDIGTSALPFRDLYLTGTGNANSFYQVGTFTPTLTAAIPGTLAITYAPGRFGEYIRLGRMVFINLYFQISTITVGTATGEARISGFPFAAGNDTIFGSIFQIINVPNTTISVAGNIRAAATYSSVALNIDNGTVQYIQIGALSNSDFIQQSGCYMMA